MFCGCVGVNGGGLAHYVGQEKLAPMESWSSIAFAPRLATRRRGCRTRRAGTTSTPTSGATRRDFTDYHTVPADQPPGSLAARAHDGHAGPRGAQRLAAVLSAVRPQPARRRRARPKPPAPTTPEAVVAHVVERAEGAARCGSRSRIPTRRRTGRASGSSGAATR